MSEIEQLDRLILIEGSQITRPESDDAPDDRRSENALRIRFGAGAASYNVRYASAKCFDAPRQIQYTLPRTIAESPDNFQTIYQEQTYAPTTIPSDTISRHHHRYPPSDHHLSDS